MHDRELSVGPVYEGGPFADPDDGWTADPVGPVDVTAALVDLSTWHADAGRQVLDDAAALHAAGLALLDEVAGG